MLIRAMLVMVGVVFASTAFAKDVGQIKTLKGTAHIERDGKNIPATLGMKVQQSDTLVTGADGSVGITFSDNSRVSAGPGSVLQIDQYEFNTTTHVGKFDASLKKGTLAVVSGKMVKQSPESMRIRTPASIMGVRGTEFIIKVTDTNN